MKMVGGSAPRQQGQHRQSPAWARPSLSKEMGAVRVGLEMEAEAVMQL